MILAAQRPSNPVDSPSGMEKPVAGWWAKRWTLCSIYGTTTSKLNERCTTRIASSSVDVHVNTQLFAACQLAGTYWTFDSSLASLPILQLRHWNRLVLVVSLWWCSRLARLISTQGLRGITGTDCVQGAVSFRTRSVLSILCYHQRPTVCPTHLPSFSAHFPEWPCHTTS